jgi:hypothetical protein
MTEAQINEEFTKKVKKGIFKPVARYLTNPITAEDRLQDAICQVWLMYSNYVKRGKILDDALLVKKCMWSVGDLGRSFVPAEGRRLRDVYDPRAYRDGHVKVHRVDLLDPCEAPEGESPMDVGLAEAEASSPERKMNSAIDLESWVGDLTFRDQALMQRKWLGFETTQTAHDLDLPYAVAWHREKELGKELAARAGVRIESVIKKGVGWRNERLQRFDH